MQVIEAEFDGVGSRLQVFRGEFPKPNKFVTTSREHHLLLFLPPIGFSGQGRFPEFSKSAYRPLAPTYYRPAGVSLETVGTGGKARAVRYSFTAERLRAVAEQEVAWGIRELEQGLDLERSSVGSVLLRLMREALAPGFASATLIDALGTTAIVELLRSLRGDHGRQKADRGRLRPGQVSLIHERSVAPALEPPSVAELAQLCKMSERTFMRCFKQTTGETVAAFVRRVRVDKARNLLANTDLALKEIAYLLGFTSHSNFAATFHREVGITPFDYRQSERRRHPSI